MALHSPNTLRKENVSPHVLIASIVILVLLIVGLGWHFLGPRSGNPRSSNDPFVVWERQKALESKGEIGNLNPADQQKLIMKLGPPSAMTTLKALYLEQAQER